MTDRVGAVHLLGVELLLIVQGLRVEHVVFSDLSEHVEVSKFSVDVLVLQNHIGVHQLVVILLEASFADQIIDREVLEGLICLSSIGHLQDLPVNLVYLVDLLVLLLEQEKGED